LFSLTNAAAVTCGIMNPEFSPAPAARNGGKPSLSAGFTSLSIRRSLMPARALNAIARKSSANASGSPWKFPPQITSPSAFFASVMKTNGLSTAELASVSNTERQ